MAKSIIVSFHSIDFWSRPIFKSHAGDYYYSALEKLCDSEEEARDIITAEDLTFHGNDIEDDPMGTKPKHNIVIDWES